MGDVSGCEKGTCECGLDLEERMKLAAADPADPRNRSEYMVLFNAMKDSKNPYESDHMVDYACELTQVPDKQRCLYRWMAGWTADFGNLELRPEHELGILDRILTYPVIAVNQLVALYMGKDRDFRTMIVQVWRYAAADDETKEKSLAHFYSAIAPTLVEEYSNGPSQEFLGWAGKRGIASAEPCACTGGCDSCGERGSR